MIELRCSGLPLFVLCPSSHSPDFDLQGDSRPASLGTGVHTDIQRVADGLEALDIEDAERQQLVEYAEQALAEIEPLAVDWENEAAVARLGEGWHLTGHVDKLSRFKHIIVDWKSGWLESDYSAQTKGYALCCAVGSTMVSAIIPWLRRRFYETVQYTEDELVEFHDLLTEKVRLIGKAWNPGPHCTSMYCPRRLECPHRRNRDATALTLLGEPIGEMLTADQVVKLDRAIRVTEKLIEIAKQARKCFVQDNGPVAVDDRRELAIIPVNRTAIDPLRGWQVLVEALGENGLADCVTIGKTKVEKAVKASAGKGKGAAKVREVMKALDVVDALRTKTTEQLKVRTRS